jgi:hypothetical protein
VQGKGAGMARSDSMASTEQLEKWCVSILALIAGGTRNVDDIIEARGGARMSTLMAIKHLGAAGVISRYGNTLYKL